VSLAILRRAAGILFGDGRILLGVLNDDELLDFLAGADLVARTPRTITDPQAIFALICEARDTGVSYNDEELELGMRSLSVAVHGPGGDVIAAMSVSASSARVSAARMRSEYRRALEKGAQRLSQLLADH
jgi:IclR family pca regulon transcriptional regulator